MDCPICNQKELPDHTQFCPKCETDLFQFSLHYITRESINSTMKEHSVLSGKVVELSQKMTRLQKNSVHKRFAWLFGLSLLAALYFGYKYNNQPVVDNGLVYKEEIESLKKELKLAEEEKGLLNEKIDLVGKNQIIYVTKEKDNLWRIAELFFNDPAKRFQIGKENGIHPDNSDNIPVGDTLLINLYHFKK